MIGENDEVDGQMSRIEVAFQYANESVDMMRLLFLFGGVWTVDVSGVIGVAVVERDEVRTLGRRKFEPRDHLIDAFAVVELVVEVNVFVGTFSGDHSLGAGPEE